MHTYRELLRDPQVRAVSLAVLISGVGGGAIPLALVLLVREQSGSFAAAGAVVAALGVAVGVFNPIRGRLVDRKGHRRTLAPLALVHACALVALVALAVRDAPTWALVVMAVVAGAAPAPLMSSLRALWRDLGPRVRAAGRLRPPGRADGGSVHRVPAPRRVPCCDMVGPTRRDRSGDDRVRRRGRVHHHVRLAVLA